MRHRRADPFERCDIGDSSMGRTSRLPSLAFTNDAGQTAQLGLFAEIAVNVREFGAVGDGVADDTTAIQAAIDAAEAGSIKTVVMPPGSYRITDTIEHRAGVVVRGAGSPTTTIVQSSGASPVWRFASGIVRGELTELTIRGQGGGVIANRTGTGVSLVGALFVTVSSVEIWDFVLGIDLSDGTPYSAHNVVGPRVEVNGCTTGVRALANCNHTLIFGSRVFYSFGANDDGIGIDIVDASALTLLSNNIESADTCVRVRSGAANSLRALIQGNYLEPGSNPISTTVGSAYDVVVDSSSGPSNLNVVHGRANTVSADRGTLDLRPSAGHTWDAPSSVPFGAMIAESAEPKRNLVRNGSIGYYNAGNVPDWSVTNGATITVAGDFVTGVRSLQATATAIDSAVVNTFVISDPGVEWITVGVRYKVLSGTGFSVTAASGANLAQRPDPRPADDTWRELHVTVRRDPTSNVGAVHVLPDTTPPMPTGECLIDEVWAVPGRHAINSTQYGERIELSPAPIVIASATNLNANSLWGPIDLTDLPTALSSPLDDFSTAPPGVCGGILRLRLVVHDAGGSGLLASHNWIYANVPGAAPLISSTVQRVTAIYGNNPVEGTVRAADHQRVGWRESGQRHPALRLRGGAGRLDPALIGSLIPVTHPSHSSRLPCSMASCSCSRTRASSSSSCATRRVFSAKRSAMKRARLSMT